MPNIRKITLREKCPNTEFLLVLFLNTEFVSVFSPNAGKYGPEKTPYLDTFHAVVSSLGGKKRKKNLVEFD